MRQKCPLHLPVPVFPEVWLSLVLLHDGPSPQAQEGLLQDDALQLEAAEGGEATEEAGAGEEDEQQQEQGSPQAPSREHVGEEDIEGAKEAKETVPEETLWKV